MQPQPQFPVCGLPPPPRQVQQLARDARIDIDWRRLLAARHTRQFEALLTAPLHGFSDVDDYYRANCCHDRLEVRTHTRAQTHTHARTLPLAGQRLPAPPQHCHSNLCNVCWARLCPPP